ncbi:MAG: ABC transporter permease [Bacteroidales bacterium]
MRRLLKIEFRKLFHNTGFWVLLGLYLAVSLFSVFVIQEITDQFISNANQKSPIPIPTLQLYHFPNIWQNVPYILSFFRIFLGILVMVFICNEYSYKTIRSNIFNGMSRKEILGSKILSFGIIAIFVTLFVFLLTLIFGLVNTPDISSANFFDKMSFIPVFFLDIFMYMCFAMLVAQLLKKAGLSIAIFLLYSYIVEKIIVYKVGDTIGQFFPLDTLNRLIPPPNIKIAQAFGVNFKDMYSAQDVIIAIAWTIIFIALNYWILKKRDF